MSWLVESGGYSPFSHPEGVPKSCLVLARDFFGGKILSDVLIPH